MAVTLLCVYAGVLMHVSRRRISGDAGADFYVCSRSGTAGAVAMSIVVSCVGASATMGMAGLAFAAGTPAFWWLGSGAAGLLVLSLLLAARVRASGCLTMPEMIEKLMGRPARKIVSVTILAAWTAILAAQFSALEKLLVSLTGWPAAVCLAAGYLLIAVHTAGGQGVIIRTDRVQFWMLLGGLGVFLGWLTIVSPGWSAEVPVEAVNGRFGGSDLMAFLLVAGGNYLVCPMLFGRLFSARSPAEARRGGLLAAAALAGCAVLITAAGIACRAAVPAGTPPDLVLTAALDAVFPGWLAVPVMLALVSAVVSSGDSCLVTSAGVLCHDLLGNDTPRTCRRAVAVLGAAGLALAVMDRGILGYLFMAYGIYVGGAVMPVFIAVLCGKRRRMQAGWAAAAIMAGGILGAVSAAADIPGLSTTGMAVSAAAALAGLRRIPDVPPDSASHAENEIRAVRDISG